jgi:hypothetical protein
MDSLLCERHCRPQLGCRQRDDDDEAEPQLAASINKGRHKSLLSSGHAVHVHLLHHHLCHETW